MQIHLDRPKLLCSRRIIGNGKQAKPKGVQKSSADSLSHERVDIRRRSTKVNRGQRQSTDVKLSQRDTKREPRKGVYILKESQICRGELIRREVNLSQQSQQSQQRSTEANGIQQESNAVQIRPKMSREVTKPKQVAK